jgi:hypothetical protein
MGVNGKKSVLKIITCIVSEKEVLNRVMSYEVRIRKIIKGHFGLILIIVLSLFPLVPLLHFGLPLTHDGIDHVARIANFYKGLSQGIIFPRWAENLNWGYGHPILMFLYPFSSYLASLFHFLTFSYIDSVKLVFGVGYIAGGVTMYLWAREEFDEHTGIAVALLYQFAPYRFIDLYVRGAIGEHMAFIFPPLILYFIFRYIKKNTKRKGYLDVIGIAISFALLLLAHNAISLMFLPVIALYALYKAYEKKKLRDLLIVFSAFVWGLLLSGFFTFPAFFEGKYTLRDIVTGNEYATRFVTNPLTFLYGNWNYGISGQFSVQLGIIQLLGLVLSIIVLLRLKKRAQKIFLGGILFLFVLSIFVMLPQSNFLYESITTLKKFQFPWRFLSVSVFTLSILGASIFLLIKNKTYKTIGIIMLIVFLILTTHTFWKVQGYVNRSDSFFDSIYHGTTDTGESAPIWSVRFMEKEPTAHVNVISGEAEIKEGVRTSTNHEYSITVNSNEARIRENTLYFPNWIVYANGKKLPIQFQDPSERGLITFTLPKGKYKVDVTFADTKLRVISDIISIFSLCMIPFVLMAIYIKKKK